MTFVERLDSLIKAKKMNRTQFLEVMKFGKNQISYWEKNNTRPKAATLDAIAVFFGVSVDYLIGRDETITNTEIKESTNVITDSPNATISVNDGEFSKQEREIIDMFRGFSLQNQVKFLSYALKLKESEE